MKILKHLGKQVLSANAVMTQYDICANAGIAIDEVQNQLFFCRMEEKKVVEDSLSLSEAVRCEEINVGNTISSNKDKKFVSKRVGLTFILKDKQKQTKTWDLFNSETGYDYNLEGELQIAAKWTKIANQQIGKIQRQAAKDKTVS